MTVLAGRRDATTTLRAPAGRARRTPRRRRIRRTLLGGFLFATAALWLFPVLWAAYTSFRPFDETARLGYVSLARDVTLDNYVQAWNQGELPMRFVNTLIVVVPALVLVLLLASAIAFAVSHFAFRWNVFLLLLFTAGNLLPPQVIIVPLFRIYLSLPLPWFLSDNGLWYDQYFGIVAIQVAFQMGFAVFVLSNFMKTIPTELTEAALVDGASLLRTFWNVIMPMSRPALAALAALEFAWMYNDFYWALVLMPSGDKRPITTGLNDLQGLFFSDSNLLAAGSLLVALPPLIVYLFAQRHFVKGLMLGSTTG
jgi:multiple sugar transport system permease protein